LTDLGRLRNNPSDGGWDDIKKRLDRLTDIGADAMTASKLVGIMSPWIPKIQDDPSHIPNEVKQTKVLELSIKAIDDLVPNGRPGNIVSADGYRFPQLERSVKWILDQKLMTSDELSRIQDKNRVGFISLRGVDDRVLLGKFRDALAESVASGESQKEFQERIQPIVKAEIRDIATVYRTKVKTAYVEGLDEVLSTPVVSRKFAYVYFSATRDGRVRDHHWDLDGFVVAKGTKEYQVLLNVLKEWNCRCSMTPVTETQAKKFGIKTYDDLPRSVKNHMRTVSA
jgi:hypothetical protein